MLWGVVGLVALVVLAGIGVGGWALMRFLSAGPAPAQALPEDTLAYAAVDLDPSGEQKIAALRALNKFPAFSKALDLSADDDVRKTIVQAIAGEAGCRELDYSEDVADWIGKAFAVAAVPGEQRPHMVVVLQVADESAVDGGVQALAECLGGAGTVQDGWALLARSEDVINGVQSALQQGSLADSEEFQQWIDAVGGRGIARAFVSAEAGAVLAQQLQGLPLPGVASPEALEKQLQAFGGMAVSVRFEDGGVTLEYAAEAGDSAPTALVSSDAGAGELVGSLPEDTVAALGVGWADDWVGKLFERLASTSLLGEGVDAKELLARAENATGLDLPDEAETLLGEAAALAVGPGLGLQDLQDPRSLPVGLKVRGDPEAVQPILKKLRAQLGPAGTGLGLLQVATKGSMIAYSPSEEYRQTLVHEGDLGGSEQFQRVLPDAEEAAALLYVDFDGTDDWAASLARAAGAEELAANLEPLQALGISTSVEDGVTRVEVRLSLE